MADKKKVLLHVYDVTNSPDPNVNNTVLRINGVARSTLGIGGIFHGAVEVFGEEWSFGYCERGSGVFSCRPKSNPYYTYRETVDMGETKLSAKRAGQIIAEMSVQWPGVSYDMLGRNCNHFCDELCVKLGVGPIPAWVNRFARTGDSAAELYDQVGQQRSARLASTPMAPRGSVVAFQKRFKESSQQMLEVGVGLFSEAAPETSRKVTRDDVAKAAESLVKQAVKVAIFWAAATPPKAAEAAPLLSDFHDSFVASMLLLHACSAGAAATWHAAIRSAAEGVVSAATALLDTALTTSNATQRAQLLPRQVGVLQSAYAALKKLPVSNEAAVGRALVTVAASMKDVAREVGEMVGREGVENGAVGEEKSEEKGGVEEEGRAVEGGGVPERPGEKDSKEEENLSSNDKGEEEDGDGGDGGDGDDDDEDEEEVSLGEEERELAQSGLLVEDVDEIGASFFPPQEPGTIRMRAQQLLGRAKELKSLLPLTSAAESSGKNEAADSGCASVAPTDAAGEGNGGEAGKKGVGKGGMSVSKLHEVIGEMERDIDTLLQVVGEESSEREVVKEEGAQGIREGEKDEKVIDLDLPDTRCYWRLVSARTRTSVLQVQFRPKIRVWNARCCNRALEGYDIDVNGSCY
ncbi:unnamed protein product [Closterium sp. NIES-64]|nr:unnamed protein product [Closterium sp. NIES-64]